MPFPKRRPDANVSKLQLSAMQHFGSTKGRKREKVVPKNVETYVTSSFFFFRSLLNPGRFRGLSSGILCTIAPPAPATSRTSTGCGHT